MAVTGPLPSLRSENQYMPGAFEVVSSYVWKVGFHFPFGAGIALRAAAAVVPTRTPYGSDTFTVAAPLRKFHPWSCWPRPLISLNTTVTAGPHDRSRACSFANSHPPLTTLVGFPIARRSFASPIRVGVPSLTGPAAVGVSARTGRKSAADAGGTSVAVSAAATRARRISGNIVLSSVSATLNPECAHPPALQGAGRQP